MKPFLILALFAIVQPAHASCFRIEGKDECLRPKDTALIGNCKTSSKNDFDCDASRALAAASKKKLKPTSLAGGKEPGAVLCHLLKGTIVPGFDRFGNQESFCRFADKSLVTCTSLWLSHEAQSR